MLQRKRSTVADEPKASRKPKRSSSFGRIDTFRLSNPGKHEQSRTDQHTDGQPEPEGEHGKAGVLGKKMKAISTTMLKRMGRTYAKALSEETVEDTVWEHSDQAEGDSQGLRTGTRRTSNSLEHLYSLGSQQNSSRQVTSGTNGSGTRDSVRLKMEVPHTGPTCGRARVHTDFVPSPYDTHSLRLKVGDVIDVISKPAVGMWTGVLHDKVGTFKFIYVDVVEEEEARPHRQSKIPVPTTLQEFLEKLCLEEYAATLLLNGYQTVEDLWELKEQHLCELNMTDPEHRRLLLAATHCLAATEDGENEGDEEPLGSEKLGNGGCPRDWGCYVTPEDPENGRPSPQDGAGAET